MIQTHYGCRGETPAGEPCEKEFDVTIYAGKPATHDDPKVYPSCYPFSCPACGTEVDFDWIDNVAKSVRRMWKKEVQS